MPAIVMFPRRSPAAGAVRLALHALTLARAVAAPVLFAAIDAGATAPALGVLAASAASDAVDGRLARRFGVASAPGAWAAVTADLLVATAAFAAFAHRGVLPAWLLWVILGMFTQFVATSVMAARRPARPVRRPVYDPVGRSFGAALFVAAGATLVAPAAARSVVPVAVAGLALMSQSARVVYLLAGRHEAAHG
jgi:phosphatidylglycerophosphate synthase